MLTRLRHAWRQVATIRCTEKDSLSEKYEKAIQWYLNAVLRMHHEAALVPLGEFEVLYDAATAANTICETAERALRQHMEEHGC